MVQEVHREWAGRWKQLVERLACEPKAREILSEHRRRSHTTEPDVALLRDLQGICADAMSMHLSEDWTPTARGRYYEDIIDQLSLYEDAILSTQS